MPTQAPPESQQLEEFSERLHDRHPYEKEFHQAVMEVARYLIPYIQEHPEMADHRLLDRLTEPDRSIQFRVSWVDDDGQIRINRGYRVQYNNAIGPYKGGLRFHPSVNLGIFKFLGFEQTFKNSLTGLPIGAGKGGADFDPKGKSDREVMRFCQAFMQELFRHIGPEIDVPAGDTGVGSREIGYLFGMYKKLTQQHQGVLTGKGLAYGGSQLRTEATGYGCVYFAAAMLDHQGKSLDGKRCLVSGAGNVAQHAAEKALAMGATVLTMSDSDGTVYDENGIDAEKLQWIKELKNNRRGRIREYAEKFNVQYLEGEKPWSIPCDIAFPCATQNELDHTDAAELIENGCLAVVEGANMPSTAKAAEKFLDAGLLYAPGKAANAGGVAASVMEMAQNSAKLFWSAEKVDQRLKETMNQIHRQCVDHGARDNGPVNYVKGANIAAFQRIAKAMIGQGVV